MELKEEMVSQQTVYEGIIVNVRRDKARLLDGRIANREVVEHPGGVAVFAMDGQGRVALVRQFRYPLGEVTLELPAGKLEPGEDPRASGLRELAEENSDDEGWIFSSQLRDLLVKKFPDFDVRNFKYKKFVPFIESLGIFESRKYSPKENDTGKIVYFRLK